MRNLLYFLADLPALTSNHSESSFFAIDLLTLHFPRSPFPYSQGNKFILLGSSVTFRINFLYSLLAGTYSHLKGEYLTRKANISWFYWATNNVDHILTIFKKHLRIIYIKDYVQYVEKTRIISGYEAINLVLSIWKAKNQTIF